MNEPQQPDDYEALLAAGTENSRYQRMMEMQKAQAEHMRQQGAPAQGQMVSGHYVAPNITQHLGSLANSFGAAYKDKQFNESGAGLDKSMGSQNALILNALRRNQQAGQSPMPAPQAPQYSGPPQYPTGAA